MSTFNPFIATNPRLRKNKPSTEGATAGAAKVPRVGVNKSDLEAQAAQHCWIPRALTYADIQAMSSAEMRYHEVCNSENFQAALQRHENIQQDKHNQAWWDVRKKWTGHTKVSDEERQRMKDVAHQFEQLYPQYTKSEANSKMLWFHLRESNGDPTKLRDVIQAYEELVMAGTISLDPSAISAGPESSVSGTELTTHRHFHLLLQSHRRPTAEESMSAQDFFDQHKELHPGKPYLIRVREQQQAEAEKSLEQAEQATVKAGSTSLTDYGPRHSGAPQLSDIEKASLLQKVRTMSARELADKCENDPSFKAALDALDKD